MKATIIVAHPDDEIIWAGGLIIQNPQWQWTVLSLCRADDPDRSQRFRKVCNYLNIKGLISDLDDSPILAPVDLEGEIGRRILDNYDNQESDLCITHGANGEYGHQRHCEIHRHIKELFATGQLRCKELWTFAYQCETATRHCMILPDADIQNYLNDEEFAGKKHIIQQFYGFAADSFEVSMCINQEAFNRLTIDHRGGLV